MQALMNNSIDGRATITAPRICELSTSELCQRGNLLFDLGSLIVAHLFQLGAWQGPVKCPVVQRDCIKHWRGYHRLLIGVYRPPARVTFAKLANKVDHLRT